ncbi:MAG: bifunctional DNA-formamidopyrimidine glycosylase/DNA-(apurinic or apyrimidinic site) lyase [Candidatus Protistobacter heckmanni]|nr:bifunctional DNA-formamidopyrimidine glycosylase/DNA-(apurinic or apyrimidinic site) lyase [Candidatus Protistobacter heckmanni]
MPELPEVEVVRQGLEPRLGGGSILRLTVRQPVLRWPIPAGLDARLRGASIGALTRRGKYLLIEVRDKPRKPGGDARTAGWLIFHLGMSGNLTVTDPDRAAGKHNHVDMLVDTAAGKRLLRLHDPRRFGALLWHDAADGAPESHPLLAGLGVEPLSEAFAGARGARLLFERSRGRKLAVKQLLMAGQVVVGVGNIYASESLFQARIHPLAASGRVSLARYERLAQAIREILAAAIKRGGSTFKDFVGSDGQGGYFQLDCMVYGRAGEPCRVCGTPIRELVIGQRNTFYCPSCQRV